MYAQSWLQSSLLCGSPVPVIREIVGLSLSEVRKKKKGAAESKLTKKLMALSLSCCLNLPPPPQSKTNSASQSLHSKSFHLAWPKSQRQRSCLLGVATVVIGLEMINLGVISQDQVAFAWDLRPETVASKPVVQLEGERWSDRRTCPPWLFNSLETIVPENLPRPYFHRRWGDVEFPDASSQSSSQITSKIATVPNKCFSL